MDFPAREKAAVFASEQPRALRSPERQPCPGACVWGRDTSCMQEQRARQSHPSTKHTCTEASAGCQVSAPLPKEMKLQEGWEKPWGTVEGGTQMQRSCSLSHSHSSLSRVSECKGPVSQIQPGKGHGQPLKGRSGSQLCVLWPWYTPCPGHSIGSCPPKPRAP